MSVSGDSVQGHITPAIQALGTQQRQLDTSGLYVACQVKTNMSAALSIPLNILNLSEILAKQWVSKLPQGEASALQLNTGTTHLPVSRQLGGHPDTASLLQFTP